MQNVWYASFGVRKGRDKNIYLYLFPLRNKIHKKLVRVATSVAGRGTGIDRTRANSFLCLFFFSPDYMSLVYIQKSK